MTEGSSVKFRNRFVVVAVVSLLVISVAAGATWEWANLNSPKTDYQPVEQAPAIPPQGISQPPTGIVIPMFTNYSLIEVDRIIQAKSDNPSVPFLVVANPSGGPGPAYNATYAAGIKSLQDAGITVLGYVPTTWGERDPSTVEHEALQFYQWYGVDGIYLDQMYNLEYSKTGVFMPTYYSTLTQFLKAHGLGLIFGNSGADVPYYFVGIVSTIGDFENAHLPKLSMIGGWHSGFVKSNFAFFSYNISSLDPYYIASASDYEGYMYMTNGQRPFPYNHLPPYFDQLVSDLRSLVPVTIRTATPNGTLVDRGFNVTVTQPNGLTNSGWSPSTFDVVAGSTVTISLKDSGGFVFDHWGGGGTNSTIVLSPTNATVLTAYSKTSTTNASLVTVYTMETSGIPVTGIHTVAAVNGSQVASGYTPFVFVATRGVSYSLTVEDYHNYTFTSWADGSSNRSIMVVPNNDITLNAIVRNGTGSGGFFNLGLDAKSDQSGL
jgi:Spherulation-specific family 4